MAEKQYLCNSLQEVFQMFTVPDGGFGFSPFGIQSRLGNLRRIEARLSSLLNGRQNGTRGLSILRNLFCQVVNAAELLFGAKK